MKAAATLCPQKVNIGASRLSDYVALTKPRVTVLVLFTVAVGALLAGNPGWPLLIHTLLGTALVAGGASALNQLLERDSDAVMQRTANRPLPAGRLQPAEVLVFSLTLGVGGVTYLALTVAQPLAALVAGLTFVCYVFVYTPLKRRTSLNTLVGAVPGALPPLIGWTAVRGSVGPEGLTLFAILFLWQIPHFLAIAWIYREDYARAGLRMLPVVDRHGSLSGRCMVSYCLALIPVSLTPVFLGMAGPIYLLGALLLGLGLLGTALRFLWKASSAEARQVLRASLIYLPGLLALLLLDGMTAPVWIMASGGR